MIAGCSNVRESGQAMSPVIWQEGENVVSARDGVAKIADTDKKPASGGAVLYGQVLSPKGATASWKVVVPDTIEQAKIVFRYGRLHWRAEMKPATFTMELTGPDRSILHREIAFGPTRGWGTKPGDYELLSHELGPIGRGEWTIKLTSISDLNDLSVDGFFIAPADLKINATELNEANRIAIDSKSYIGISAPPIVHQDGAPALKMIRRTFSGETKEVRPGIRKVGEGEARTISGGPAPTTQQSKVTHLQLPPGLHDGDYELVAEGANGNTTLTLPVIFAGEFLDSLTARVQRLQSFTNSLEAANDARLIALKPTMDHIIQFAQNNQRALADTSGQPVDSGNVRREGLAEQEGAAPTTPSLDRLRRALDQAERTVAHVEAKRAPYENRTGEFRMAYRSAVDGRLAAYRLYVPSTYDKAKRVPTILFLHGGGGDENYWPELADGQILKMLEERGYIGIMPHWNRRSFGEHWMQDHLQLLDEVSRTWPKVDSDRVYLTGISMGGGGTFRLAVAHPERFAAICCVSGPGDPEQAASLKALPMMIIHGGSDTVSPPERAVKMNEVLQSLGHQVSFHLFPLHGHNYHAKQYLNLTLDFFDKYRRAAPAGGQP